MEAKTITAQEVIDFITKGSKGRFFAIEFIKRTDGSVRMMNCRYGVKKYVSGVGAPYNHDDAGVICVWEKASNNYRMIPKEGILRVEIEGVWYEVK